MSLARSFRAKVLTQKRDSAPDVSGDTRVRVGEGKKKAISAMALQLELKKLKDLNTIAQKIERKRTLLEKYEADVKAWIDTGGGQSELFVHYMIWLFDTGDYQKGLEYAEIALARQQNMPARFNRDVQTFVADAVLEGMDTAFADETAFNFVLAKMRTGQWNVHEAIQYKYLKRLAEKAFDAGDWQAAHDFYSAADQVYDGAKVKTRLAEVAKKLNT
jgi:tetratricopeptide (TPR) repeat protein